MGTEVAQVLQGRFRTIDFSPLHIVKYISGQFVTSRQWKIPFPVLRSNKVQQAASCVQSPTITHNPPLFNRPYPNSYPHYCPTPAVYSIELNAFHFEQGSNYGIFALHSSQIVSMYLAKPRNISLTKLPTFFSNSALRGL